MGWKRTLELYSQKSGTRPIDIISDFATKTREFSMKDHADKRDRQIFNVAYEIATDILEITRCLK